MTATGFLPLTPAMKDLLKSAHQKANEFSHEYLGVEHVLLALVEGERSLASDVLNTFGVSERLKTRLREIIQSEDYSTPDTIDGDET